MRDADGHLDLGRAWRWCVSALLRIRSSPGSLFMQRNQQVAIRSPIESLVIERLDACLHTERSHQRLQDSICVSAGNLVR